MAAFDKVELMERLAALGWTEDESAGPYRMIPPRDLFENAPKSFHAYDAERLQSILTEFWEKEDQP